MRTAAIDLDLRVADLLRQLALPPPYAELGDDLIAVPLPVLAWVADLLAADSSKPPIFPSGLFPLLVPESAEPC